MPAGAEPQSRGAGHSFKIHDVAPLIFSWAG